MDRAEFLRELEEALAGEVSPATAAENLRYYDAYIAEEMCIRDSITIVFRCNVFESIFTNN